LEMEDEGRVIWNFLRKRELLWCELCLLLLLKINKMFETVAESWEGDW
jgi:hypothetical protein